MKVYDIISESSDLDEAPMGLAKKALLKVGSKVPGFRGTSKAKLDVGNDANAMKKDLANWMAGSGIKTGQLSVDDFKDFLSQKGLDASEVDSFLATDRAASGVDPDAPMQNPEVDQVLKKAVQKGFKAIGAKGNKSRFAAPDPAAGTPPAGNPPASGGAGLPAGLSNAINSLTPAQKAALKALL